MKERNLQRQVSRLYHARSPSAQIKPTDFPLNLTVNYSSSKIQDFTKIQTAETQQQRQQIPCI